jgi:hypothetical protein
MAKRPIWLIATGLALFGLQVPLCALACMQGSDAESVTAQQAELPCHAQNSHEQSRDASPSKAPCSEEDCGCDFAYEALLPIADGFSSHGSLVLVPLGTPGQVFDSSVRRASAVPTSSDLPPPDILLLKSTLLI